MDSFNGATVIVTGGGSGIGQSTAIEFANRGAAVVVADIDVSGGESTVERIRNEGGTATFVETNVTEPDAVQSMIDVTVDEYGQLDYAFNNAGIDGDLQPLSEYPAEEWQRVLDVNLSSVFHCMKAELNQMQSQQSGGVIVNNASVLGKVGFENSSAYCAAKHGVIGLTKTAAIENGESDVRVNAICPGFIETELLKESLDEEMRKQVEELHPVKRLGSPNEIADAVAYLCSDRASFVNGEAFNVDGGYLSQ